MGHKFAQIAFTDAVRKIQQEQGSRENYAAMDEGDDYHNTIGQQEGHFIAQRDSFYLSSVSETGWPYVQHRGGPPGFMRVLNESTIGFADFRGNRQYVSTGNFQGNDRVALFFMDYPNRRRLKLLGRIRVVNKDEPELLSKLKVEGYRALVERGFLITVSAFDWNCPQHITPRYTQPEVDKMMASIIKENQFLKQQLGELQ
jgi:predicted pyridoxine 5'-phosphate oxidase superfamily flavin-nucleotide-binding protein